jgi:hypothetical protein
LSEESSAVDRSDSTISGHMTGGEGSRGLLDELGEEQELSEDQELVDEDSSSENSEDISWLKPVPIPLPHFNFRTFSQDEEDGA